MSPLMTTLTTLQQYSQNKELKQRSLTCFNTFQEVVYHASLFLVDFSLTLEFCFFLFDGSQ